MQAQEFHPKFLLVRSKKRLAPRRDKRIPKPHSSPPSPSQSLEPVHGRCDALVVLAWLRGVGLMDAEGERRFFHVPNHQALIHHPTHPTTHHTAMYGQDQGPKKYGLTVPQKKPLPFMRGRPPPASAAARRRPPGSAFSLDNDDSDGEGGDDDLASKAAYNKMLQVRNGGLAWKGGVGAGLVCV